MITVWVFRQKYEDDGADESTDNGDNGVSIQFATLPRVGDNIYMPDTEGKWRVFKVTQIDHRITSVFVFFEESLQHVETTLFCKPISSH